MHPYRHPAQNARPPSALHRNAQQAQQAVNALTSALSNPYANSYGANLGYGNHYPSHYAQAYLQASSSIPMTTPEGYTISSAYTPPQLQAQHPSFSRGFGHRGPRGFQPSRGGFRSGGSQQDHWYESGTHRCTYEQCAFTGSKKSVEIHMMDRHLIYPPGWEKRQRKPDWDADPSLNNGKPIPIQGTGVILDTPEAVESWIAERRKRWPTAPRVEEKQKRLQDAISRGEILAIDLSLRGRKRQRTDEGQEDWRGRGQPRGSGNAPQRGGQSGELVRGRGIERSGPQARVMFHALPKKPVTVNSADKSDSDSDSDSGSGSDMDPERDGISSKLLFNAVDPVIADVDPIAIDESLKSSANDNGDTKAESTQGNGNNLTIAQKQHIQPISRRPALQPRTQPRNAFAARPSLLRNLLLPEIHMTVSNLSQAIHFLVENDFLKGVELKPGDTDKPIEVVSEIDSRDP